MFESVSRATRLKLGLTLLSLSGLAAGISCQGPTGPEGAKGPIGPTGPTGPTGPAPASGWQQVRQQVSVGNYDRTQILCPAGKKAVHSGGFNADGSVYTLETFILSDGSGAEFVRNPEPFEAIVTCINP